MSPASDLSPEEHPFSSTHHNSFGMVDRAMRAMEAVVSIRRMLRFRSDAAKGTATFAQ